MLAISPDELTGEVDKADEHVSNVADLHVGHVVDALIALDMPDLTNDDWFDDVICDLEMPTKRPCRHVLHTTCFRRNLTIAVQLRDG